MTLTADVDAAEPRAPLEARAAHVPQSASAKAEDGECPEVFVCIPAGDGVTGVHMRARRGRADRRVIRVSGAAEGPRFGQEVGRGCLVIGLVPKSLYLLRTFEVPRVLPHEVPAMLRLELTASLPPEMGAVETSYRRVPARRDGYDRYEAYAARREDLARYLEAMGRAGVTPDVLLPTAVCWACAAVADASADLLVVGLGGGNLEAASVGGDETVSVRALRRIAPGDPSDENGRLLVECVRSLLPQRAGGGEPVMVGWLAAGCPSHMVNGRIRFWDVDGFAKVGPAGEGEVERLLGLAAMAVARCPLGILAAANLLPADVLRRQQRAVVRRTALLAGACLVAAAVVAFAALRVAVHRSRAQAADLSGRIARIRTDGDAVGRRLEQLRAVRGAKLTGNDFTRLVAGLADATPPEVSYSSVELTAAGQVRLQGQAASLSMPFLLPERLEKVGPFTDVMLQDAGQTKKGEGSVAEFRIECSLKREASK